MNAKFPPGRLFLIDGAVQRVFMSTDATVTYKTKEGLFVADVKQCLLVKTVDKETALTASRFQHIEETDSRGEPREARRTGKTKVWKTRPEEFKVPVKFGLYESFYITHENAHLWFVK